MTRTLTARTGTPVYSSGGDAFTRTDWNLTGDQLDEVVAIFEQGVRADRPSAGIEGRFYAVVGDPNPVYNGMVFYDNGAAWSTVGVDAEDVTFRSSAAGTVPLTLKGSAGQTGDMLRLQDSTGTNKVRFAPAGGLTVTDATAANVSVLGGTTPLTKVRLAALGGSITDMIPLVARGAVGQTASLEEWQKSDGTVYAKVGPVGTGQFDLTPGIGNYAGSSFGGAPLTGEGGLQAALSVVGANSRHGLVVKAGAGNNALEVRSSDGTLLLTLDDDKAMSVTAEALMTEQVTMQGGLSLADGVADLSLTTYSGLLRLQNMSALTPIRIVQDPADTNAAYVFAFNNNLNAGQWFRISNLGILEAQYPNAHAIGSQPGNTGVTLTLAGNSGSVSTLDLLNPSTGASPASKPRLRVYGPGGALTGQLFADGTWGGPHTTGSATKQKAPGIKLSVSNTPGSSSIGDFRNMHATGTDSTTGDIDASGILAGNGDIEVPTPGVYVVQVEISWDADNTGIRMIQLQKNGAVWMDAARIDPMNGGSLSTLQRATWIVNCTGATDTLSLATQQNSGHGLHYDGHVVVYRLGGTIA